MNDKMERIEGNLNLNMSSIQLIFLIFNHIGNFQSLLLFFIKFTAGEKFNKIIFENLHNFSTSCQSLVLFVS